MPFSTQYDTVTRILLVHVEGPVTTVMFDTAMQSITTAAEYAPNVDTIWEFHGADFSAISADGMRSLLAVRARYAVRAGSRTAFVVGNEVAYGMSRMFQLLADGTIPQDLSVHRSIEDAHAWVLAGRTTNEG